MFQFNRLQGINLFLQEGHLVIHEDVPLTIDSVIHLVPGSDVLNSAVTFTPVTVVDNTLSHTILMAGQGKNVTTEADQGITFHQSERRGTGRRKKVMELFRLILKNLNEGYNYPTSNNHRIVKCVRYASELRKFIFFIAPHIFFPIFLKTACPEKESML